MKGQREVVVSLFDAYKSAPTAECVFPIVGDHVLHDVALFRMSSVAVDLPFRRFHPRLHSLQGRESPPET